MDDWIEINRDERHIKRERAKARELRNTPYFQAVSYTHLTLPTN